MIFRQMFSGGGEFTLTVSSNTADPDIPVLATAAGWNGYVKLLVNITASYINTINLRNTWVFPNGIEITISSGTLVGGNVTNRHGLIASVPCSVRNNGTIAGVGGDGVSGIGIDITYGTPATWVGNGGWGAGGAGQKFTTVSATTPSSNTNGTAGTYDVYPGALLGGQTAPYAQGGNGGVGGPWGQDGAASVGEAYGGSYSFVSFTYPPVPAPAGRSVSGNSFITWLATGTRLGPIA